MQTDRVTTPRGTAAFLQDSSRRGFPVMIPGAREPGASRPAIQAAAVIGIAPLVGAASLAATGRALLEYQRQGGGAPGERQTK
jgi:hypothetical protein